MEEQLVLVEPSIDYAAAFTEMAEECHAAGEHRYNQVLPLIRSDFAAYVNQLEQWARGENLPEDHVPWQEYWLLDHESGRILGAIRLRSQMTPRLERIDGQIGYNIRPSARGHGYATRMLAMILEKIKQDGWQRVLITCNADNIASARVIEKNCGRLENQVIEEETGRLISRYWIDLA